MHGGRFLSTKVNIQEYLKNLDGDVDSKLVWRCFDGKDCGGSCGQFMHRSQQEVDLMTLAGILHLSANVQFWFFYFIFFLDKNSILKTTRSSCCAVTVISSRHEYIKTESSAGTFVREPRITFDTSYKELVEYSQTWNGKPLQRKW